jgi:hypothetical protein
VHADADSRQRTTFAGLILLLGFCAAVYLPFLGGGILTDDFVHLHRQATHPGLSELVTTPDPFQFYRPVVQASFWANTQLSGLWPAPYRVLNLALHLGCILGVYFLARELLASSRGALFAALAFAFTPKAHPIAVLWISARSDVMMALFSLLTFLAWLRWVRSHNPAWFIASCLCYLLALLSKETALLLPVLLALLPGDQPEPTRWNLMGIVGMLTMGAVLFAIRTHVGAMMPTTANAHYGLIRPLARWIRSLENYNGRVLPNVIGLLAIVGVPIWLRRRTAPQWNGRVLTRYLMFAIAWFGVFILPVLPIPARSELYLYFPGVGLCLLAAAILQTLSASPDNGRLLTASLVIYALLFGTYQATRSYAMSKDLDFSAKLMSALRAELTGYEGPVSIHPDDPATAQLLTDSVGGYGDFALKMATGRDEINGRIDYDDRDPSPNALKLGCAYRAGVVELTRDR